MQPRRAPIPSTTHPADRAESTQVRQVPGAPEKRVVSLVRSESDEEPRMRRPEPFSPREEERQRFEAFIDGLRDLFVRGGIAEVRKLALAAASSIHATESYCAPRPGERAARLALAAYRRRSEVDMFTAILSTLDRARRRGGTGEALAEFSRIGRRIGRTASPRVHRGRLPPRTR